jgi:hypothetical protein
MPCDRQPHLTWKLLWWIYCNPFAFLLKAIYSMYMIFLKIGSHSNGQKIPCLTESEDSSAFLQNPYKACNWIPSCTILIQFTPSRTISVRPSERECYIHLSFTNGLFHINILIHILLQNYNFPNVRYMSVRSRLYKFNYHAADVTKLHASRLWKDWNSPPPQPRSSRVNITALEALPRCESWAVFTRLVTAVPVETVHDFVLTLKHPTCWRSLQTKITNHEVLHYVISSILLILIFRAKYSRFYFFVLFLKHAIATTLKYKSICNKLLILNGQELWFLMYTLWYSNLVLFSMFPSFLHRWALYHSFIIHHLLF